MTSKSDNLKTNEFLRLRKLRLQQVREQSKDIAKKIRQRAKVEQLRHVTNVDSNKEREYLRQQVKLVNRLEELYSKGLKNVGAGHKNACEVNEKEISEKKDLSKLRGKEAVAVLKKKKQEKLDEQKKILDRKLQAREVANVLSREKFNVVANTLMKSSSTKSVNEIPVKDTFNEVKVTSESKESLKDKPDHIAKNDMGTQWEFEEIPTEWEPHVPSLHLPNEDSIKNSADDNVEKSDKNKRLNLFALSDEMPSSLRGGTTIIHEDRVPIKPSLTLVSEYLQNRGLRLREPDSTHLQKKSSDDLQSIKQTLLRTRASRTDVSARANNIDRFSKSDDTNRGLRTKNSVTMYDHNTRDNRDMPHNVDKFVIRDDIVDDDAYSQAVKESSVAANDDKPHHVIQQDVRNKLAITRQNVDKEYRDTLAFLRTLPKEKPARSIKTAYMDGDRQQEVKDRRQQKLQQAYKKIEKQCSKHHCKNARNTVSQEQNRSKSKSPARTDVDNNFVNRDFQYSWLPVPESDGNMAIHTISNSMNDNKHNKPGNSVKFSSVDTYHEYRSRHKHTPPTKDVDTEPPKRLVEAVIIQEDNDTTVSSSDTDTSSVENLRVNQDDVARTRTDTDKEITDAERIIIYKVMESKKIKKHKTKKKRQCRNNVDKSYSSIKKQTVIGQSNDPHITNADEVNTANTVSFKHLKEGVYKSVSANEDNFTSLYFSGDQCEDKCSPQAKNTVIDNEHDRGVSAKTVTEGNNCKRKSKPCENCKNTGSHQMPDHQASAATSTSSFKTAVNDKTNNVLLDDGYVKFLDEGGQDTGKFYVGASGFLKDDAYEVIIQLRKKEAESSHKIISKDDKIVETTTLPQKINEEHEVKEQSAVTQSNNGGINLLDKKLDPVKKPVDAPIEQCDLLSSSNTNIIPPQTSVINEKVPTSTEINVGGSKQDVNVEPPQFIEKAVSTTSHDSFAIPDNMAKLSTTPRAVTSTYTQTTQHSPNPRPVLMHLSSSTSTTYMSPPDIVLPKYLRHGGSDTCDDTYEPISSHINSQNVRSANCKVNRCAKCKKRNIKSKADTPPNSTRSTDHATDNIANEKQCYKIKNEVRHIKQHKCKNSVETEIYSKQKCKRSSSENKRLHCRSNYTIPLNKKRKVPNSAGRLNLNPVVENYIKQLLTLNKESLKAIEVVNQECSAINTPGSSIIDVPSNIYKNKSMICNQISLEQIKNTLKDQILKDIGNRNNISKATVKTTGSQTDKMIKLLFKSNRKRPVHKVKSLNISKQFCKPNKETRHQSPRGTAITTPRSVNSKIDKKNQVPNIDKKNITTPRRAGPNHDSSNSTSYLDTIKANMKPTHSREIKASKTVTKVKTDRHYTPKADLCREHESYHLPSHKATSISRSSESELSNPIRSRRNLTTPPISISTQTNQIDSEVEFMKIAENKLQNMEKIADLTEKCTKRLSNLAKVLEEVRRNKSLAYSQISSSECTSDSEQRSNMKMQANNSFKTFNPVAETQTSTEISVPTTTSPYESKIHDFVNISGYAPILTDLPKPDRQFTTSSSTMFSVEGNKADVSTAIEHGFKSRGKPPPALTRINLKHAPEGFVIPHELSTVVEVDSPMSLKLKSYTTQINNKNADTDAEGVDDVNQNDTDNEHIASDTHKKSMDPSSLSTRFNTSKRRHKVQHTDSSDDLKIKMMDLKHFNDIMLKPFITVQEYAKQYKIDEIDGQPNFNRVLKDENPNEELSSLHSEGSIPDVMAELLKRNLISEPFKFETTSNANSTTSESTLSLLALSRAQKDKQKATMLVRNKENNAETSASLSISSNPDLEHAFQRLGMGWASSTLKKTKERLALSSSSNTSSSSLPQLKLRSFHYQDVPELSSLLNISNKERHKEGNLIETPKNAVQQTALTNSMTVKEFLANELAKKITFSNQTTRNTTGNEFISLYETKMPEELKQMSQNLKENDKSADSVPNTSNARARTSTPVQIYKSMTYHSTSSSNTSNGLFSNADDLSSVKGTSNSIKNHSTSDKDDLTSLTIPNYTFKMKKGISECTKSD